MFDKVKQLGKAFVAFVVLAAATAALEFTDTVDWQGLGIFGVAGGGLVAAGVQWFIAWWKKETTGYGAGVPKPSDAIPGGQPLPTGAHEV